MDEVTQTPARIRMLDDPAERIIAIPILPEPAVRPHHQIAAGIVGVTGVFVAMIRAHCDVPAQPSCAVVLVPVAKGSTTAHMGEPPRRITRNAYWLMPVYPYPRESISPASRPAAARWSRPVQLDI
ncbi:hypothetical protein [Paraburkholderia azotifigens]|uniref:hypothetical protein n=1 Tax=Paraburkholderia azotifigens TaxID=2057004 RepID=UPI0038BAABF5